MSSELVGQLEHGAARRRSSTRRPMRELAIESLGLVTILAGLVWAVAQPYRIAFLYPEGKGFYDYIAQPPLLVVVVGLIFAVGVAPGLLHDLREGGRGA
jgi:hypothetical protein